MSPCPASVACAWLHRAAIRAPSSRGSAPATTAAAISPRRALVQLLRDPDAARAQRAAAAMMKMKKIDIAELERAAA
jgi:hypothetical protein